jgi:hypothetical protein
MDTSQPKLYKGDWGIMSIEAAGKDRGGSPQLHVRRHLLFFLLCWFGKLLADGQYRGLNGGQGVSPLANFFPVLFVLPRTG